MSQSFSLFGLEIHLYGLMIAIGILLAVLLAMFTFKYREQEKDSVFEILLWVFPLAIVGARLYFLIFNGGPWGWESFAIWNGGLAVYGSIIGGAAGAVLYCVVRKKNFLDIADVVVPCLALGQCLGRIGCYFGGCCYGIEVTDPGMQWFPLSVEIDGVWHYSTFFYESICDLLICVFLFLMLRKTKTKGVVFASYLISYGVIRALIEGIRGESLYIGATGIRVSQLLSILLVIAGIVLLIVLLVKKKQQGTKIQLQTNDNKELKQ